MRVIDRPEQPPDPPQGRARLHPDVIRLGFVSLLTDVSSEMIFSIFAVFFTTVIGGSAAALGVVEGLADLSSCSLDYLAGWLADLTGRRKPLAVLGYAFSSAAKLILPVAGSTAILAVFRIVERLGKSIRGPPRDAWLATVAGQSERGYSFGVHKALDKSGAVLGPLVAFALLSALGEGVRTYHTLFALAIVPAVAAVVLLLFMGERFGTPHGRDRLLGAWGTLNPGFKRYVVVAGIFSVGYFSFAFLLLRAYAAGFSVRDTALLYALFNGTFVLAAPLVGRLGDRIGRSRLVLISYGVYLLMCVGFAFAQDKGQVVALFGVYGIFYSIDEVQSRAFIADVQPQRRATALGAYNFVTGMLYLVASVLAGALWTAGGRTVFAVGAATSFAAMVALLWLRPATH
jgi:MFS family permease